MEKSSEENLSAHSFHVRIAHSGGPVKFTFLLPKTVCFLRRVGYDVGMETNEAQDPTPEKMSVIGMMERIKRFYEEGKIVPERINAAAENIARRASEDPTASIGTSFDEIFGGSSQD